MLGKCSTTKLHSQPSHLLRFSFNSSFISLL
jgi:hypothetical protein